MHFLFQANIEHVHRASSDLRKSKPNVLLHNVTDDQTIYYHNVQTMNSPTQGGELLYREPSKVGINFHEIYKKQLLSLYLAMPNCK